MSRTILANPVARATDPITSDWAGEKAQARRDGRRIVSLILQDASKPLSDWQIFQVYQEHYDGFLTQQRLRTARKELQEAGLVDFGGVEYKASPTFGKAQTWKWVSKTAYRVGPRGESQPVTDHSNDPLVPEVLA